MTKVALVAAFLVVTVTQQAMSQDDSAKIGSQNAFGIRFRSIQAEAGTLLLMNTVNLACDIDMLNLGSGVTAGVRGGIQHTSKQSFSFESGTRNVGSPYTDVDFLLRLSSSDENLSEDLLFGYTYHNGTKRQLEQYEASGKLKFGGEVKWLLFKPVGGLFFEMNSTIGGATKPVTVLAVGIVIGFGL